MISKAKISEIRKLSQKKFREETGLFIVEGTKSVLDLLHSDLKIYEMYALPAWKAAYGGAVASVVCEEITANELERISCLITPQEVLAVVETPVYSMELIDYEDFILVLDGIRDPGNLGTIIRTADWFGIKQVVCSPDCVEWTNPKTVQATMGSFTRIRIYESDLVRFFNNKRNEAPIYGAFMQGDDIRTLAFEKNAVLIIGNEGKGISPEVEKCVTRKIHIPSFAKNGDHAESLNASIAAAVSMYEMRRNF